MYPELVRKKQLAAMYATWAENGENGLKRLGMNQEQIGEFKDFIEAERELFGSRARQEARLDELERATDAESLEEIDEDALACQGIPGCGDGAVPEPPGAAGERRARRQGLHGFG